MYCGLSRRMQGDVAPSSLMTNTYIRDNLPVSEFIVVPICLCERVVGITNKVLSLSFLCVRRVLSVTIPFGKNHYIHARLQIEIGVSDSSILYGTGEDEFVSLGVEEDIRFVSISFEATDRVHLKHFAFGVNEQANHFFASFLQDDSSNITSFEQPKTIE